MVMYSIALTSVLALAGCATLWSPHKTPVPASVSADQGEMPDDLDRLIEESKRFSGLSGPERQLALVREEKRYQQLQTPYNLIRLALLMSLVDPGRSDTALVVDGLREYVRGRGADSRPGRLAALAAYLSQVLEQHGRLLEENDTLQKKLNELKAIEQKLNDQNKRDMIQVPP